MALSMKAKKAERSEAAWPRAIAEEFEKNRQNGCVGTTLLSEDDRVRVWDIRLKPGERIGFHRHQLDYFWTAMTAGNARSRYGDGRILEGSYVVGDTQHHVYGPGEFMVHDLENVGDTTLVFATVEFLGSANEPLKQLHHFVPMLFFLHVDKIHNDNEILILYVENKLPVIGCLNNVDDTCSKSLK